MTDVDDDGRHECPVDGCALRRYSLLALEFHVLTDHTDTGLGVDLR